MAGRAFFYTDEIRKRASELERVRQEYHTPSETGDEIMEQPINFDFRYAHARIELIAFDYLTWDRDAPEEKQIAEPDNPTVLCYLDIPQLMAIYDAAKFKVRSQIRERPDVYVIPDPFETEWVKLLYESRENEFAWDVQQFRLVARSHNVLAEIGYFTFYADT